MTVRWDFEFGLLPEEATQRAQLEVLARSWWDALQARAQDLEDLFKRQTQWDLLSWMEDTLGAIDPALMWEFGPAVKGKGHRLVITPESRRDLRPLVRHLLRLAPNLDAWEFYAHRLPESLEKATLTVEARCGGPPQLTDVAVSPDAHHRLALTFTGPNSSDDDPDAMREAFVLAEALLGEETLDCWIGEIAVRARPKRSPFRLLGKGQRESNAVSLAMLRQRVEESIRATLGGLPDMMTDSETAPWTLLELKPRRQDEYPVQADLFVARTPSLELWRATRNEGFYDARFARRGETFCYIKLDSSAGLDEERFADKSELEDAIDAILRPDGLGCQIGGGTGLKYSYIELALTDCAKALPAIRRRLAEGNVPKRSWILFHNCERETEWIGIYDDTPVPPQRLATG